MDWYLTPFWQAKDRYLLWLLPILIYVILF